MTLILLIGLSLFAALMLCFVLLMGRVSTQGALLKQVTKQARGTGPVSGPWRPVRADTLAKPFTALRRFFATEADPGIVRGLMLAGCRKPYHADIVLGMSLALPAGRRLSAPTVLSN